MARPHPRTAGLLLILALALPAAAQSPFPVRRFALPADNWFYQVRAAGGIMLGLRDGALFRSADEGSTWKSCRLPGTVPRYPALTALAFAAGSLWLGGVEGLVLRSDDEGLTWQRTKAFPPGRAEDFPVRGDTIWLSSNEYLPPGAETPLQMKPAENGGTCYGTPFMGGRFVFAGGGISSGTQALCRTTGPAEPWSQIRAGLPAAGEMAFGARGETVFATDRATGLWVLDSGVSAFRRVKRGFGFLKHAFFIGDAGRFILGTRDSLFYLGENPDTWQAVYHPRFSMDSAYETRPWVHPIGLALYTVFGNVLSVSSDSGRAWMPVPMPVPPWETAPSLPFSFAASKGNIFIAYPGRSLPAYPGRIYRTADSGSTWKLDGVGSPNPSEENPGAGNSLHPSGKGIIAWGGSSEILAFDPAYGAWERLLPGPPGEPIRSISVADGNHTLCYARHPPMISRDGGRSFARLGLPAALGDNPYVADWVSEGPLAFFVGGPDRDHATERVTFDGWKTHRVLLGVTVPVPSGGCLHWGDGPELRSVCDRDGPIRIRRPPMGAPQKWWTGPGASLLILINQSLYRIGSRGEDTTFALEASREELPGWTFTRQGLWRQSDDRLEWAPFDTSWVTGMLPWKRPAGQRAGVSRAYRWADGAGSLRDARGRRDR